MTLPGLEQAIASKITEVYEAAEEAIVDGAAANASVHSEMLGLLKAAHRAVKEAVVLGHGLAEERVA